MADGKHTSFLATVERREQDLLVDPSGKVIEVEEEIPVVSAPAPVQEALTQKGTVLRLEQITRSGATTYEASIRGKSGKKSSVTLDARGKTAKG